MDIKRTFDFLDNALENFPKDDAFSVKRNGKWDKYSTQYVKDKADLFSLGLIELGFKKGEKIATVSNNRPEWNIVDFGMEQIGIVHVPIYPTIGKVEYKHILSHSDAKILILSSKERYDFINPFIKEIPNIEKIYSFDTIDDVPSFEEIIKLGEKNKDKHDETFKKMRDAVDENDLSSIIYTSGTTGLSKGVMMTHKNFVRNVIDSSVAVPKDAELGISFLPLNHVFERMINYLYVYLGIRVYYAESIETLVENIQEIKPHLFAAVPRIFEKLYDKIYSTGLSLKGIKKTIFFWALKLGERYDETKDMGSVYNFKLKIANKLVFVKWREVLGNNLKVVVSGGAALQPRLARVFGAAQIPVLEGYGLSETAPVIAVNRQGEVRAGTVGKLLESAEVKIADDGEILFKGPNLMPGYYKDEEKTKNAIDKDGWFHTGDTGELDGRILKITGRTKEIFKLSTGKYVAPELVENKMKESPFIEQMMIVGEGEKYTAAIVCPAFEHLHNWASIHNINYKENYELITNPEVINKYEQEIERLNNQLDKAMKIKKFSLVCEEWTPETGELSPTLKLKRKILVKKYKTKLDFLYGYTEDEGFIAK
ncbi:MAG: long-chain fatty acid--CoA ligase [Bacteroidales bacterium]|nr:long-chain fatty acid--CoA ligase [Bacteroidales bacterium]